MNITRRLTLLGTVYRIVWQGDRDRITRFKKKTFLACNGAGTSIYLLPGAKTKKIAVPGGYQKQKRMYLEWTEDHEVDSALEIYVPDTPLRSRGRILEVIYDSDKFSARGRPKRYQHEFESLPSLFNDSKKSPRVWAIRKSGKKLVTSRGIIG